MKIQFESVETVSFHKCSVSDSVLQLEMGPSVTNLIVVSSREPKKLEDVKKLLSENQNALYDVGDHEVDGTMIKCTTNTAYVLGGNSLKLSTGRPYHVVFGGKYNDMKDTLILEVPKDEKDVFWKETPIVRIKAEYRKPAPEVEYRWNFLFLHFGKEIIEKAPFYSIVTELPESYADGDVAIHVEGIDVLYPITMEMNNKKMYLLHKPISLQAMVHDAYDCRLEFTHF